MSVYLSEKFLELLDLAIESLFEDTRISIWPEDSETTGTHISIYAPNSELYSSISLNKLVDHYLNEDVISTDDEETQQQQRLDILGMAEEFESLAKTLRAAAK